MEKDVSSPKILNIILCIIILVTFCIVGAKVNVQASENTTFEETVVPVEQER